MTEDSARTKEAREAFDEWFDDGPYGNCDAYIYERMKQAWQAGSRSERGAAFEEAAKIAERGGTTPHYGCTHENCVPSGATCHLSVAAAIRAKASEEEVKHETE